MRRITRPMPSQAPTAGLRFVLGACAIIGTSVLCAGAAVTMTALATRPHQVTIDRPVPVAAPCKVDAPRQTMSPAVEPDAPPPAKSGPTNPKRKSGPTTNGKGVPLGSPGKVIDLAGRDLLHVVLAPRK